MEIYTDKLRERREIIYKLSKGIDPTTDKIFEEDTILNHPVVKKSLSETAKYLDELIRIKKDVVTKKAAFNLTHEQAQTIDLPKRSITISHLVHIINEQHKDDGQRKLGRVRIMV